MCRNPTEMHNGKKVCERSSPSIIDRVYLTQSVTVIRRAEQSCRDLSVYSHACSRSEMLDGSSPVSSVGCNCKVMMFFWEPCVSREAVSVPSLLIYHEVVERFLQPALKI